LYAFAVDQERKKHPHGLIVLIVVASFGLTLWYATSQFVATMGVDRIAEGYDAFRYDKFARENAQQSLVEILASPDIGFFDQAGYPVLLSLLYGLTTPDPLVGCLCNWLLWLAAGFLLCPLAKPESSLAAPLPFLALWLLYPEGIDWNGTTSKEPLVAFAVACAIRTCSSRAPRWVQILLVGALALLMLWVRSAVAPLIVLAFAISFEFRRDSPGARWSKILGLALAAVVALYVAGGAPENGDKTNNPLSTAGFSGTESLSSVDVSSNSLLLHMGSDNRVVDALFFVPLRGLSHLFCPLYTSPFEFPLGGMLVWLSSGVCSLAVLVILLRFLGRQPWTCNRAMLLGVLSLGLMALGLTGIIHQRYRSIIVPALLPLGMRSFREEVAARGFAHIILIGTIFPLAVFVLYRIAQLFWN
jgi:hypothetical protein